MANSFKYKDNQYRIGDTVKVTYRIKEGAKERDQIFEGVILQVRGQGEENKMVTIRKITKSGIGVERILPLTSPFITKIDSSKKTTQNKAKLYFVRNLSQQKVRHKIYKSK